MIKKWSIFLTLTIACFACRQEQSESTPRYDIHEFYPLQVGAEYTYLVDSIYHDDFNEKIDTFQFQLKEVYTDTFVDLNGDLSYRLERYKRFRNDSIAYENLDWQISDVWWVTKKENSIERVEENLRIVNLTQPISDRQEWNGNVYNQRGFWEFEYDSILGEFKDFTNTVKVVQRQLPTNQIAVETYLEYYSKDIGLVGKIIIDVESQNSASPLPVIQRVEKGFQYRQVLVDYQLP
jgi:hypothetical protein